MGFNHEIKIRLTREQREKVIQDSKRHGFQHPTQYVRWMIIDRATETEEKINIMYKILKEKSQCHQKSKLKKKTG